MDDNIH
jgi:hypothetical protein